MTTVPCGATYLIERLWKSEEMERLSCRYHEDVARFEATISERLNRLRGEHKPSIKSQLTLNFQTFEGFQLPAG